MVVFSAKISFFCIFTIICKKVVNTENVEFLNWIVIKVKSRKIIFEVSLLDFDIPFVKLVEKLMYIRSKCC
jgi:hypothetical protein